MGKLVDGNWVEDDYETDEDGSFQREKTDFRNRVRAEGGPHPAESDRYHLYVSRACPWAHRTTILRRLKGLTDVVSMDVVDPYMGGDGWWFSAEGEDCTPDTVNGKQHLREVYREADPDYTGRVTVPVLWDKQKETIVNNESREIMRMLDHEFEEYTEVEADYCPDSMKDDVERIIDVLYEPINNGVYRAGFAQTQQAYEKAVTELFQALDHWEDVLDNQPFLAGDRLTEADWCMFTTLYRFDPVYHTHFKCNLQRLIDYDNLWDYTKQLYQYRDVSKTCNLSHVKQHYYRSHQDINPSGIVPKGPYIDYEAPYDRPDPNR